MHFFFSIDDKQAARTLAFWAFAIAVNSLAGPAILQLPFQFQQSGLVPTTLFLIVAAVLS